MVEEDHLEVAIVDEVVDLVGTEAVADSEVVVDSDSAIEVEVAVDLVVEIEEVSEAVVVGSEIEEVEVDLATEVVVAVGLTVEVEVVEDLEEVVVDLVAEEGVHQQLPKEEAVDSIVLLLLKIKKLLLTRYLLQNKSSEFIIYITLRIFIGYFSY